MLRRLLLFGFSMATGGSIYLQQNPVSINSQSLINLLHQSEKLHPEMSLFLFKVLLKMRFLTGSKELNNSYILQRGFDIDGSYLKQLENLGLKGVEIGPVSLNASIKGESNRHLGLLSVLANLNTFKIQNPSSSFEIILNIVPNYEVIKFTPYILKENIVESIKTYSNIQQISQHSLANKIIVDFDREDVQLPEKSSNQFHHMIQTTKNECGQIIQDILKNKNFNIPMLFKERNYQPIHWKKLLHLLSSNQ